MQKMRPGKRTQFTQLNPKWHMFTHINENGKNKGVFCACIIHESFSHLKVLATDGFVCTPNANKEKEKKIYIFRIIAFNHHQMKL